MQITLREVNEIRPSLERLLKTTMPIIPSFRLGKVLKEIINEQREFDVHRDLLVRKYGVENPEKTEVRVPQEKVADFMNELNKLLDEKFDIAFSPIEVKSLGDISMPVEDMIHLQMFFADE